VLGLFLAFWALGKVAASLVLTHLLSRLPGQPDRRLAIAFVAGSVLMSVGFVAVFHALGTLLAMFAAATAGMGEGMAEICYQSRLQQIPERARGRIDGVASKLFALGFMVGNLLVGPLIVLAGPTAIVTLFHGFAVVSCFALFVWYRVNERTRRKGGHDRAAK
jgi:predicted MFS family arabinose efflux permease